MAKTEKYKPKGVAERIKTLKERFETMNTFVRSRQAWILSVPGAREIRLEVLEGSNLPAELKRLGYVLSDDGTGERILPTGIEERLARGPGGTLVPYLPGITGKVTEVRHHAGIVRTKRFTFDL